MSTKKIILFLFVLISVMNIYSQNIKVSDVPSAVRTKFASMYPNVEKAKWEIENSKYEAEFRENNVETSALFESNGTYVQTEIEIPVSSLPAGVNEYVSKNLNGKKITEACQITNADGNLTYEVEIGKDDYLFDSNGNFLKKDSDSGDTEDDDKK